MHGLLEPVACVSNKDLYYVPVRRHGTGDYTFHVAFNFVRNFTKEELPDTLLEKVVMLQAVDPPRNSPLNSFAIFDRLSAEDFNYGLEDIGWWVSADLFMLIVDSEMLEELKGTMWQPLQKEK